MIALDNLPRHPFMEMLVDDLVTRTGSTDETRHYFRTILGFYFSKIASNMRAFVSTEDEGDIPINCFSINIAGSGFGKGKANRIIESEYISAFRHRFMKETFPIVADQNLWKMAIENAAFSGKSEDDEKAALDRAFKDCGAYLFTTKSATAASVQQARIKLLLSSIASICLQVDEIGLNIEERGVREAMTIFLDLYDMGHTEMAMTKNTNENVRIDDLDGCSPANMLLFGTDTKLLTGGSTEEYFLQMLDTGYARRCLFAWGIKPTEVDESMTYEEEYKHLVQVRKKASNTKVRNFFGDLADPARHNWRVEVPENVSLRFIAYRRLCKKRALAMNKYDTIQVTEMEHRHMKALKLAGALAFIDERTEMTDDHYQAAISIVEDSGKSLKRIMSRDEKHVTIAKYLAEATSPQTHAEIYEKFPFYTMTSSRQKDFILGAVSWGYKNNIIIKKHFEDGIEFFTGESLKETNLDEMIISYSDHEAYNYQSRVAPFSDLSQLVTLPNHHWCNHHFDKNHRSKENVQLPFNTIVVDVDGDCKILFIQESLGHLKYLLYTTKRHTDDQHRFRLILPMSYNLELNEKDYSDFMKGVLDWLPFSSDPSASQISKKWQTYENAQVIENDGALFDPLPFIPKTSRNQEHQEKIKDLASLDNIERWYAQQMAQGNRNDNLIKYALWLVDSGLSFSDVETTILAFNNKLADGLDEDEIRDTILVTVAKKTMV